MYQYSSTGKQISIQTLTKALKRLGDLLQKENKRLELTCCGGIISLMYFHSRAMTQDGDAIFPANPANKQLLIKLIKQVGDEMGLAADEKSLWFNDSVSFFGLETTSNVIIFQHPFLILKAASWEELLARAAGQEPAGSSYLDTEVGRLRIPHGHPLRDQRSPPRRAQR